MANEQRLIDANALRQTIESKIYWLTLDPVSALEEIDNAPTIEAEPVVHAEWIRKDGRICCGHCGYTRSSRLGYEMRVYIDGKWVSMERTKRCPDCGAHMDLKEVTIDG